MRLKTKSVPHRVPLASHPGGFTMGRLLLGPFWSNVSLQTHCVVEDPTDDEHVAVSMTHEEVSRAVDASAE